MIAAILAAGTTIVVTTIKLFKVAQRFIHFLDDYFGTEERPGVERKPGVAERLKNIEDNLGYLCVRVDTVEKELQPNHGTSLRDSINRIEKRVLDLEDEII